MTVITKLIDLPTRIKGQVVENEDGSYSIFINARLSTEQQKETYQHEIRHIEGCDFEKEHVQRIEAYAHGINH